MTFQPRGPLSKRTDAHWAAVQAWSEGTSCLPREEREKTEEALILQGCGLLLGAWTWALGARPGPRLIPQASISLSCNLA